MNLIFSDNPIIIKNGEYKVDIEIDNYIFKVYKNNSLSTQLATYQLFYHKNYKGYVDVVIYSDFKTNIYIDKYCNDENASSYFSDVHDEEIMYIVDNNSGIKIKRFVIYKGYIRQIFYWRSLGYDIIGINFINNKDMKNLKLGIKSVLQERYSDYEKLSNNEFEKLFLTPDNIFAQRCECAMGILGIPYPLTDDAIKQSIKKDIVSWYVCEKILSRVKK